MELVKIFGGDKRVEIIDRIYQEAFPPNERFGMNIIMRLANQGHLNVFALTQNDETVGLLITCEDEQTAYVCYFAIDKALRGHGLGGEAIRQACRLYQGKQVVLEIEALEKTSSNFSQRKRRESFYLRHGFAHTNRYIRYEGVTYELLFAGRQSFDEKAYDRLLDRRKNKNFRPVLFNAKQYSTYIFDLDGTLLDTLTDLTLSANFAVESVGCPPRTIQEINSFVGNGIELLIRRALPKDIPQADFEKAFEIFKAHYKQHCCDNTKPYDGITDMLRRLKAQGKRIAVVSNKADFAVCELCRDYFGDLIDICAGEKQGVRKKPAADMVLGVINELGVKPSECVYIGDSDVDVHTAENSGLDCISVLWGFRSEEHLIKHGAKAFAQTPGEICLFTYVE